jgi:hypothetical protein
MRQQFKLAEMLLAPAARILQFDPCVITDGGQVAVVEEHPGISEVRYFMAVPETS